MLTPISAPALLALLLIACTAPNPSTDDGDLSPDGGGASCGACGENQVCEDGACRDLPQTCPCPKGSYCDLAASTCKVGCLDDMQCNGGQFCDTAARTCQSGCNKDSMCSGGDICVDRACRAGCRKDSACPGSACNPATFTCSCTVVTQLFCATDKKCTTRDGKVPTCEGKGAAARGAACTGSGGADDCAAGLYCKAEGAASLCRAFCNKDSDCGMNSFCDLSLASGGLSVCTQPCAAAYPGSGCAVGLACHVEGEEHTNCEAPGASAEGGACTTSADCKTGLTCIDATFGGAKCRRVCNKGDMTGCGTGNTCFDIHNGSYNWKTYGACCPNGGC